MRLTLRQLQIFCAIARAGSTAAAAKTLALSQSATSAALGELESALRTQLFDRNGRRLVLNDNGRALLPTALSLLDNAQSIENGFRESGGAAEVGLRLAASTTIGNVLLPPLLAIYRRERPDSWIDVRIGNTQEVEAAVADFDADLGFIEGPCHGRDLVVRPWLEDELVIVAAPTHPLSRVAAKARLGVRALRAAPWLLREAGSGTREAVEQSLLPHLGQLRADMTLGSSEAIKTAVAHGLGITCLSRIVVADMLATRELVLIPTTLPRLARRLALIHHVRKQLSRPLKRFVELCFASASAKPRE